MRELVEDAAPAPELNAVPSNPFERLNEVWALETPEQQRDLISQLFNQPVDPLGVLAATKGKEKEKQTATSQYAVEQ